MPDVEYILLPGLVVGLVAGIIAALLVVWRRWAFVNVRGDFTVDHHLPDEIPVPRKEVQRVRRGEFSLDEAAKWMTLFVHGQWFSTRRKAYREVLKKYSLYQQLSEKMGRGQWRDVVALGQRLADVDPLDPSAFVVRGRAMRELGDFNGAVQYYQQALTLSPFHSAAFAEMAATCRMLQQPGKFRAALEKARHELGETHPLTIEGRIQLGELVPIYADPKDPATLAHIPREHYLQSMQMRLDEATLDARGCLLAGRQMLDEDLPELAQAALDRCHHDFGECAEGVLLQAMIERYHLNIMAAELSLRRSLDLEDSAIAHLELGRLLLEEAAHTEDASRRSTIEEEARQHLRLAIDRDANLVDAVWLLAERGWTRGLAGVLEEVMPLVTAYPTAWTPWRVMGDAYAAEGQFAEAVASYQQGLAHTDSDDLLVPLLNAMEQAGQRKEMLPIVRNIRRLRNRDPQLRWKASQVLCENQRLKEARRVLQSLVDDERVAPPMRQRANDVLDQLDDMEREQFKGKKA
jgi:tetratricopeptide (TPR) repeat protein